MNTRQRAPVLVALGAAGALLLPPALQHARLAFASGPPTTGTLVWQGTLTQGSALATGTHAVTAQLFDAEMGGTGCHTTPTVPATCTVGSDAAVRCDLTACTDFVSANRDLWLEIKVDGTASARSKLGAAPFAVEARNASELLGDGWCPAGYTRDTSAMTIVLCTRPLTASGTAGTRDEMVRVGGTSTNRTARGVFWVDRYEASAWGDPDGAGTQYGAAGTASPDNDYATANLPKNGQWITSTPPAFALSRAGVKPSVSLTWFQANEACRASGKRLMTNAEWFAAARGSIDDPTRCNIRGNVVQATDSHASCVSLWGTRDMIGNVWEWTAEWYAGLDPARNSLHSWPTNLGSDYGEDDVRNIDDTESLAVGITGTGFPAAAIRGGSCTDDRGAGTFALVLDEAPSYSGDTGGFRCVTSN